MDALSKLFSGMRIASSGLKAERKRIDTIAANVANAQTTKMPGTGEPYRRQVVNFGPLLERTARGETQVVGVEIRSVDSDFSTPFEEIYDPTHPDADSRGIVRMPNVNTMREMADLITAVRAYEANVRVKENFQRMAERALRLAE